MTIRVLMSPWRAGRAENDTVRMLVDSLPGEIVVLPFAWSVAFAGHYDVLHVHWPETLLRARRGRVIAKRALFVALLVLNRIRRLPSVWTVHNLAPHEPGGGAERWALRLWDRWATSRIFLYAAAVRELRAGDHVILRGDYAPLYGRGTRAHDHSATPLLTFGLIRRYKKIERVISAVAEIPAPARPELLIAGAPVDGAYAEELAALAAEHDTIRFMARHLSNDELAMLIRASELVVLSYRDVYNSGAALLALTLGRPVLVSASPTMDELRAEVGAEWVYTFEDDLSGTAILEALEASRRLPPGSSPDLAHRDWAVVGRRHEEVYRSVTRARRARGPQ